MTAISNQPVRASTQSLLPGIAALVVTSLAMLAGLLPVFTLGLGQSAIIFDGYLFGVIRFTLLQAALSTVLSLMLGVATAFALARRNFPGRNIVVRLLALPLALPAIVGVLAIVTIFGAGGWLGGIIDLYGLAGIVIAHVFFNFPLAARFALSALDDVPPENLRLASQLGFSEVETLRHIDGPALTTAMPGAALLIFLLCAASFTIVLTLGGGPNATTLEVAIYQSLRFDFDPARATTLALAQIAICSVLVIATVRFPPSYVTSPPVRLATSRRASTSVMALAFDILVIALAMSILIPPLVAALVAGVTNITLGAAMAKALLTSLAVSAAAAILATVLAWPLASLAARHPTGRRTASAAAIASLILPPAVMATGWFIALNALGATNISPFALVVCLNALMALPFVYTLLAPALAQTYAAHDRLSASLGVTGWNRLLLIDWPALRRPLSLAMVMAAIYSLGDLTAVLMFGTGGLITLPALIYQQMGSYRMEGAAGTALVLAAVAFLLLTLSERWSRHD